MAKDRIVIPGIPKDAARVIIGRIRDLEDRIAASERSAGVPGIVRSDVAAKPGEFLNIEAPAAGLDVILPQATQSLRNARVTINCRNANPVRIVSVLGLVNRVSSVTNDAVGKIEAVCNGLDGWEVDTVLTEAGNVVVPVTSALDAEYILSEPHASLPNGVVPSAARQVPVASSSTAASWAFPIEAQDNGADQGDAHTINSEAFRLTLSGGVATLEAPQEVVVDPKAGGTENAYVLPSTLRHGDLLRWTITGAVTVNGIDATGWPDGFEFTFTQSNGGLPDGFQVTFVDESGSASANNRIGTPDNVSMIVGTAGAIRFRRQSSRWVAIERGFPRASTSIAYGGTSGREVQRAALTGDVTASANSNTTAIASNVIVNADVNTAAAIAQTKLGAMTGFAEKASGSAATTSAEPIVTYSASANMSAERVTTSSTSVAVSTSVAGQIEFQRAALTGEVTASANANATTVVRSTNFASAPWTGSHTWSGSGFFTVNTSGDVSFTSAIFGAVSSSTVSLSSVGATTIASSAGNVVVSALALYLNGDGFLLFDSASASTPSLTTQQGLIWVSPSSASAETLPRYTDGSNADRYVQLSFDSFLTSTATGAIGTVALKDDQNVFRWNGGANADIDGFSGNLWNGRQLLVRNASGTAGRTLTVNHDSATTVAHGVHGPANAAVVVRNRGSSLLTYDTTSSRWFHTVV